jgi:hypothetical protein
MSEDIYHSVFAHLLDSRYLLSIYLSVSLINEIQQRHCEYDRRLWYELERRIGESMASLASPVNSFPSN